MFDSSGNVEMLEVESDKWAVNRTDQAFVMVKDDSESFDIRSICLIPGFKVKESWLDYLVRLEEEEKLLLLNRECKLVCCSSKSDSKIRIMSQCGGFTVCFEILNTNTLERIEYEFKKVYGIIKQDRTCEIEYGLSSNTGKECELEYLFRDLTLILNTEKKILACKIPFYTVLSLYIKETILKYRKRIDKKVKGIGNESPNLSISLSLNIPNYKKTIWVYSLEDKYFENNSLITCFNMNQVNPYLIAMYKGEHESVVHVCLITPNVSEFEGFIESEELKTGGINKEDPIIIINSTKFSIKSHELCGGIVEDGIGFYPLKKSYIWVVSLGLNGDVNTDIKGNSNVDLSLEELSGNTTNNSFTKTRIYLIETLKSNIKLRGVIESFSYCIKHLSVLEAGYHSFETEKKRDLKLRIVSSTLDPLGLICFDTLLPTESSGVERMNISSLAFIPITINEIIYANKSNEYEIRNLDYSDNNIDKNDCKDNSLELNYSFGKGSELSSYLKKEDNSLVNGGKNERKTGTEITTLCVVPSYIHFSLGKSRLDPEISNNFPLVCCGISNGEWRIYTLKEDRLEERKYNKRKGTLMNNSSHIGYFVLKGVHILKGNEFSLSNQIESKEISKYTRVSSSCWGFERHPNASTLTLVASNNIGNIFSWSLEGKKRGGFEVRNKEDVSKKEAVSKCFSRDEVMNPKSVHKEVKNNNDSQHKTGVLRKDSNKKGLSGTLELLDRHIKRIDERINKVKVQEAIISQSEKCKSALRESKRNRGISEGKKSNKLGKNLVPGCLSRSVSPRKGCESCNKDSENRGASNQSSNNKVRLFLYKSKYDNMEYKRYRGYHRDEENECVFQLNNYFTIKHILNSDFGNHENNTCIENIINNSENIIDYDSIISSWNDKNSIENVYSDILFSNYFDLLTK
ncbi:hypothetical protein FG386_000200 [Cryptosporidium ryanae]|uniref:uncharacterized protein n=1 Tax=Cryptosporidium ryanae TaxID=515981 RepID=UPI003519FFF7|nr:hypothetical protein FG386_000200 [Cryptosporidium ryanae]